VNQALELAERIGALAPLAVGMAKLILNTCTDVDSETGRRLERLGQSVLKVTDDHREGTAAFVEKRTPQWKGR
jgi:enoyl-CoA hydratase/carnithine racemase